MSFVSNRRYGIDRDRSRVCEIALKAAPGLSNRAIARLVSPKFEIPIGHAFVKTVRDQLFVAGELSDATPHRAGRPKNGTDPDAENLKLATAALDRDDYEQAHGPLQSLLRRREERRQALAEAAAEIVTAIDDARQTFHKPPIAKIGRYP
jgi:hypothetical protein